MTSMESLLAGGDRRSIGKSSQVVEMVMADKRLMADLFRALRTTDPVLRMRCADVLEKVSAKNPQWLEPYRQLLMDAVTVEKQKEVRWHLAAMVARMTLNNAEKDLVMHSLFEYTLDASSIVKTMAMQSLADLAMNSPKHRGSVTRHIEKLTATGTPAMQARGRKILQNLKRP